MVFCIKLYTHSFAPSLVCYHPKPSTHPSVEVCCTLYVVRNRPGSQSQFSTLHVQCAHNNFSSFFRFHRRRRIFPSAFLSFSQSLCVLRAPVRRTAGIRAATMTLTEASFAADTNRRTRKCGKWQSYYYYYYCSVARSFVRSLSRISYRPILFLLFLLTNLLSRFDAYMSFVAVVIFVVRRCCRFSLNSVPILPIVVRPWANGIQANTV